MQLIDCARMKKPTTLKPVKIQTLLNIKEADAMHFMQIKSRKDGKPVGILIKKSTLQKKNRRPRRAADEIIEIIGVRERDTEHDKKNIYRNAAIVNNTLTPYKTPDYRPHKMERSNVMKFP